jgi:hypothetical protein
MARKNRPPRNRKKTARYRARKRINRRRKQVLSKPGRRAGLTTRRGYQN